MAFCEARFFPVDWSSVISILVICFKTSVEHVFSVKKSKEIKKSINDTATRI